MVEACVRKNQELDEWKRQANKSKDAVLALRQDNDRLNTAVAELEGKFPSHPSKAVFTDKFPIICTIDRANNAEVIAEEKFQKQANFLISPFNSGLLSA